MTSVGISLDNMMDLNWPSLVKKRPATHAEASGFKPGDKIKITLTGVVPLGYGEGDFNFVAYGRQPGVGSRALYLTQREIESMTLAGKHWQRGDTIAIKYDAYGADYTYVRGRNNWPGDGYPLSDAKVDELYAEGKVRHLLRNAQPVAA